MINWKKSGEITTTGIGKAAKYRITEYSCSFSILEIIGEPDALKFFRKYEDAVLAAEMVEDQKTKAQACIDELRDH